MNQFFKNIRLAISELIHGRKLPDPPPKVITVNIQKQQIQKNRSVPVRIEKDPVVSINETTELAKSAVLKQSDDTPVVLPFTDPQLLKHLTVTHRDVVFTYLLKRLRTAIGNNSPSVILFQLGTSPHAVQIARSKYESQLVKMMNWFVETENYESAGACRDLISQLKTNNVVD